MVCDVGKLVNGTTITGRKQMIKRILHDPHLHSVYFQNHSTNTFFLPTAVLESTIKRRMHHQRHSQSPIHSKYSQNNKHILHPSAALESNLRTNCRSMPPLHRCSTDLHRNPRHYNSPEHALRPIRTNNNQQNDAGSTPTTSRQTQAH
mmetsp:Transcript_20457/g.31204  ORF Transcript_20457/g.31204 Transcript_20457/m.31204 type:complete len:148 (+) Transcript_20457:103-546(+)